MRAAMFMLFAIVALGVQPHQSGCETTGCGAAAMDEARHYGVISYDDASQGAADSEALRVCGGAACKVVLRFGPNICAAVAMTDNRGPWAAVSRATKAEAELAAIRACQARTAEQCKVRQSVCNGGVTAAARAAPTNNSSVPAGGFVGQQLAPGGGIFEWWCPQPAFSPLNCKFLRKLDGIEVPNPFNR
jgi:hypothetical protein